MTSAVTEPFGLGWILLKAHLRMTLNGLRGRGSARSLITVLSILLLAFFLWVPQVLGIAAAASVIAAQPEAELQSVIALIFMGIVLLVLYTSIASALSSLFVTGEIELLLLAPWRVGSVIGARMMSQAISVTGLALFLLAPLVFFLPLALGQPAVILLSLVAVFVFVLAVVCLIYTAVVALSRFIPGYRAREMVAVLGLLLALALQLSRLAFLPGSVRGSGGVIRGAANLASLRWLPTSWPAYSLGAGLKGDYLIALAWLVVLLVGSFIVFQLCVDVTGRLYVSGWARGGQPGKRRRRKAPLATVTSGAQHGARPLALAVARKDFLQRRRDPVQLLQSLVPVIAMVPLFLQLNGSRTLTGHGDPTTASLFALILPLVIVLLGGATLPLTSLSLEGGSIWVWAVSPASAPDLLLGKVVAAGSVSVGLAILTAGFSELVLARVPPLYAIASIVALAGVAAAVSVITAAIGVFHARFDWTDPRRMVSTGGGFVALAAELGVGIVIAVVVTIAMLVGSSLGAPTLGWLGGLVVANLVVAATAVLAFLVSTAHLENVEVGALPTPMPTG